MNTSRPRNPSELNLAGSFGKLRLHMLHACMIVAKGQHPAGSTYATAQHFHANELDLNALRDATERHFVENVGNTVFVLCDFGKWG